MLQRLAVRAVHGGELQGVCHANGQQSRAERFLTRQPDLHAGEREPAEHRYAIPAFLPVDDALVAERREGVAGEGFFHQLDFLQPHHVGLP